MNVRRLLVMVSLLALSLVASGCNVSGTTTGAKSITSTSATLYAQGQTKAGTVGADVYFKYWRSNGVGGVLVTQRVFIGGERGAGTLALPVSQLAPLTTYSFKVCGQDRSVDGALAGAEYCDDKNVKSFTTDHAYLTPASFAEITPARATSFPYGAVKVGVGRIWTTRSLTKAELGFTIPGTSGTTWVPATLGYVPADPTRGAYYTLQGSLDMSASSTISVRITDKSGYVYTGALTTVNITR